MGLAIHHGAVAVASTCEVEDEELETRARDEDEGQAVSGNGPEERLEEGMIAVWARDDDDAESYDAYES